MIGVYLLVKWTIKGVVSYFLEDTTKNVGAKMQRQQEEFARQKKKQEGRVTVNYHPKSQKSFRKDEGDYIDFEEVK